MSELGDKLRKQAEACEEAAVVAFGENDLDHRDALRFEAKTLRKQAREADAGLDPYRHWRGGEE